MTPEATYAMNKGQSSYTGLTSMTAQENPFFQVRLLNFNHTQEPSSTPSTGIHPEHDEFRVGSKVSFAMGGKNLEGRIAKLMKDGNGDIVGLKVVTDSNNKQYEVDPENVKLIDRNTFPQIEESEEFQGLVSFSDFRSTLLSL